MFEIDSLVSSAREEYYLLLEKILQDHMMNLRADCCNIEDYWTIIQKDPLTTTIIHKGFPIGKVKLEIIGESKPVVNKQRNYNA